MARKRDGKLKATLLASAMSLGAAGALAGADAAVAVGARLGATCEVRADTVVSHRYRVECRGQDGALKWIEEFDNIVVTAGLNDYLDKYYKGSSYTAAHFVGLKLTGSIVAGDTLASHAGWSEFTSYSGNRKAFTAGTVSGGSVDNSGSPASFSITGSGTITGAFLATVATGTSGTLVGGGEFSTSRSVISGDTLTVTVTATMASA